MQKVAPLTLSGLALLSLCTYRNTLLFVDFQNNSGESYAQGRFTVIKTGSTAGRTAAFSLCALPVDAAANQTAFAVTSPGCDQNRGFIGVVQQQGTELRYRYREPGFGTPGVRGVAAHQP